jgi:hypothetical protein
VFYSSTVVEARRTDDGVSVTVENSATKERTIIESRRLILAIEPTESNLAPFDVDAEELDVFSKFDGSRVHAGIVTNEALPVNFTLFNLPTSAAPNNWDEYPALPFQARFDYFGTNKFRVLVVGDRDLDSKAAKELVQSNFESLISAGVLEEPADKALQWLALEDHGAMHLRVTAEELRAGFIQKQSGLQGHRSTWWTGAAFSSQFQTSLWKFNDILLEKIVADL